MFTIRISSILISQETSKMEDFPQSFTDDILKDYFDEVSSIPNGYLFKKEQDSLLIDKTGDLLVSVRKKNGAEYVEHILKIYSLVESILPELQETRIRIYYCVEFKKPVKYGSDNYMKSDLLPLKVFPGDLSFSFSINWKEKNKDTNSLHFYEFKKHDKHLHFCAVYISEDKKYNLETDIDNKIKGFTSLVDSLAQNILLKE